jgi:hypothetical protein
MHQTVQCPSCARKLAIDPRHLGTSVVCPICNKPFVAEALVEPVTAPSPAPSPQPPEPPAEPAASFADPDDLDLDEAHDPNVADKSEANRLLKQWKDEMPPVASAYQPSGRLPGGAVLGLTAGVPLGAVGGALLWLVVAALTTALLFGFGWVINWMANTCGRVVCAVVLLGLLVGVIGYGLAYAGLGWAAAGITTSTGKLGKNRNPMAALSASVGSALLAVVLLSLSLDWMVSWLGLARGGWVDWAVLAAQILGSLLALFVAGYTGRDMVRASKFCEECEVFMQEKALPEVRLGRLRALTRALGERDLEAVGDLLDGPAGQDGKPALFRCPRCGQGYAEITAQFKATWKKDDGSDESSESWLTASVELEEQEMDRFRSHFAGD